MRLDDTSGAEVTLLHHDNSAIPTPEPPPDDVPGGGRLPIFSYTVEPLAPLYRAVLRLFLDAKGRYRIQFRPDEVATELRRAGFREEVPEGGIDRALD